MAYIAGYALLVAAHMTRALWTTIFLMYFGMDSWSAASLAAPFYVLIILPMALRYHNILFTEPHILHQLLADMDAGGSNLQRVDEMAVRRILIGFVAWCASSGLALFVFRKLPTYKPSFARLQFWLLLADFIFGRALEHKAQFFALYFEEVHSLLVQSVKEFKASVEQILIGPENSDVTRVYEELHGVECRMRAHFKWVNDVESDALLAFLAHESMQVFYTAVVAFFIESKTLTCILLVYSSVQLLALLRTGLDVATPGDAFKKACQDLDTPRNLLVLSKLQGSMTSGAGLDYISHLCRLPLGVKILKVRITTPVAIKLVFTVGAPTALIALQQASHLATSL